jgi:hypothetical protein
VRVGQRQPPKRSAAATTAAPAWPPPLSGPSRRRRRVPPASAAQNLPSSCWSRGCGRCGYGRRFGPAPATPLTGARPSRAAICRHGSPAATPRLISSRSAMLRHRDARPAGCRCTPPAWSTNAQTDGPRLPSRRAISRSDSPCRHRAHTSSCSAADSPQDRTHHPHADAPVSAEVMQPPLEASVVSATRRPDALDGSASGLDRADVYLRLSHRRPEGRPSARGAGRGRL